MESHPKRKTPFLFSVALICLGFHGSAASYNFVPNEAEFEQWTYKCKITYLVTSIGKNSDFADRIPRAEAAKWRREADYNGGAWHYCAGLIHYARGIREVKSKLKKYHFERAMAEIGFTYKRLPVESSWRGEVGTAMARAHLAFDNKQKARNILLKTIKLMPKSPNAYFELASMYRDENKLNDAKNILLNGVTATDGKSAELFYMLGIVSLQLDEFENAKTYADQAYELGYPLPWLKNKLKEYADRQFLNNPDAQ